MARRRNKATSYAKTRKPSSEWGDPTTIQSLLFSAPGKDSGWTPSGAQEWALEHGFAAHKIDQPAEYIRIRQAPPAAFRKETLRTITLTDKYGAPIKAITGVRKPVDYAKRAAASKAKTMNRNPRRNPSLQDARDIAKAHGASVRKQGAGLRISTGDMVTSVRIRAALRRAKIPHTDTLKRGKIHYDVPDPTTWWRYNPRRSKRDFVKGAWERQGATSRTITDGYGPRYGLEGPFRFKGGRVLYYDPREGRYYDPGTDMFLGRDEDPNRNPRRRNRRTR